MINTIGVVGAGSMGAGIAQVCAQAGYKTILFDINTTALVLLLWRRPKAPLLKTWSETGKKIKQLLLPYRLP